MSRSIKQQWGLAPDPHAPEHVSMEGGQKLTKVYTRGGHAIDSQQKGLPVYHRRIANPYPVFAIGIGGSLMMTGFILNNIRGLTNPQITLNVSLPLGGFGVMTAAMFAFAEGNTFLATAAGSLAGLLGGYSLSYIPWTGIQAAYVEAAKGNVLLATKLEYTALAFLIFGAMIPIFGIFLASLKTAIPVANSALIIVIALIIQGVAFLQAPAETLFKAAGALFIIVGITLWYSALSVLLYEEGVKILPVLPLPRLD